MTETEGYCFAMITAAFHKDIDTLSDLIDDLDEEEVNPWEMLVFLSFLTSDVMKHLSTAYEIPPRHVLQRYALQYEQR